MPVFMGPVLRMGTGLGYSCRESVILVFLRDGTGRDGVAQILVLVGKPGRGNGKAKEKEKEVEEIDSVCMRERSAVLVRPSARV